MYTAIIFDFYGVFCSDISKNWFIKNVPNHEELLPQFAAICSQSDVGAINKVEFFEALSRLTNIPARTISEGIAAEVHIDQGMVELVRRLAVRYKLALMSNATNEWLDDLIEENGMNELFNAVVVSANIKIAKPDRGIYDYTLHALGARAEETLFIDDRSVNTDAGNSYGIKSIQFTDTISLESELRSLGIVF